MAEQEVIKHTKKVFKVWSGPHSIWHKAGEFLLEIVIIVFAVSLSIYLHERSEKKHLQHETKDFLVGLRLDLQLDMNEMKLDKEAYILSSNANAYIVNRKLNQPLLRDSIRLHYQWLVTNTGLIPNNGRFEGFKSSGKIGTIKDHQLQNDIMDLYQEDIPLLIISTNGYNEIREKLVDYIYKNRKRVTDTTSNIREVLAADEPYNIAQTLISVQEILKRYDNCIAKMTAIIAAIDREYGPAEK